MTSFEMKRHGPNACAGELVVYILRGSLWQMKNTR